MLNRSSLVREAAFVAGRWIGAANRASTEVRNPSNGAVIGRTPDLTVEEVQEAIAAAVEAGRAWAGRTAHSRAEVLRRWNALILEHRDDLANIMTTEQGKPLSESVGEITYAASFVQWFAEEGIRAYGEVIPTYDSNRRMVVVRQPVGVCAAITPWNFPAAMVTRKVGPALAAGCTMILKPAPATPFSALALAALAEEAGLPRGVLSIVTGDAKSIGSVLCSDERVRKLTFTGSTAVGKLLMAQCAETMKRVSFELGGNAPFIVMDDADLDAAVRGCIDSKFRNTGQTCICANRIFVQSTVYEVFNAKLAAAVGALRVGDGFSEGAQQGPLINAAALEKVERHLADALSKGARVLAGGRRHELGGTFFQPTVVVDAQENMLLAQEETFGPVAPVFRFETEAEVIERANATPYGLAAYVFSRDVGRVWRISERLEYGMVGANSGLLSSAFAPFGGVKQSGIGREGARDGLLEYLETKYIAMGGIES